MNSLETGNWRHRKLENHVENRTCHTLNRAELNLFETHQSAEKVLLQFSEPVLASMISGKKIMNLSDKPHFNFLPGESVIMPSNELMTIDFPEASIAKPTKCLALRIDECKITETLDELNQIIPRQDELDWQYLKGNFHFTNDVAINQIIQRLIFLFTENHLCKVFFSEMMIKELIIRILQQENRKEFIQKSFESSNNSRFSYIIHYIRTNLTEPLTIRQLSKLAQMSETAFYKAFKSELGITPNNFIIEERIRFAQSLMTQPEISIKEAYLSSGFNSFSYFCRIFKNRNQINPTEFKKQLLE